MVMAVRDGVLVVDKPAGWTSHDVVAKVRKVMVTRKVGHSGTLDPDATGVLVLGVGRATRLLRFVMMLPKSYEAEIVFGVETDTLDASGTVTARHDMSNITDTQIRVAATSLKGRIMQKPPMVSAVKIGGKRLHELARSGIEVDRPARPVTVTRFDLQPAILPVKRVGEEIGEKPVTGAGVEDRLAAEVKAGESTVSVGARDRLAAEVIVGESRVWRAWVDCSSGTYVRVLASDLGAALGGGAHLGKLRRTAVGHFILADACSVESSESLKLLPMATAVSHLPGVQVDPAMETAVRNGRILSLSSLGIAEGCNTEIRQQHPESRPWAVHDNKGNLLAVYEAHPKGAKPVVVVSVV